MLGRPLIVALLVPLVAGPNNLPCCQGCRPPIQKTTLPAIGPSYDLVLWGFPDPDGGTDVLLLLQPAPTGGSFSCPVVQGTITATMDETPMTGSLPASLTDGCACPVMAPDFSLWVPAGTAEPSTAFAMTDPAGSLDLTAANLFGPRTLTWLTPSEGVVVTGEPVALAYRPVTDDLSNLTLTLQPLDAGPSDGTPSLFFCATCDHALVVDGGVISFVWPAVDAGTIKIQLDSVYPTLSGCQGPAACRISTDHWTLPLPSVTANVLAP